MLNKILDDREKRYNKILDTISKYDLPVVCGKINYPGPDKNTRESAAAFDILIKLVKERFAPYIAFSETIEGFDGLALIAAVNLNVVRAKEMAFEIEDNNALGRIFDIDVYDLKGCPICRDSIYKDKRKCIVCGKDARECIRLHRHDVSAAVNAVNDLIKKYIKF